MKKFEKVFKIISIIFIIGCCLFYGGRLLFYYNKLKPAEVNGEVVKYIAQTIKENSGIAYENDGLYMNGSEFVFRGGVTNNYLSYSDRLWRIIKINQDGTVKLVLNEDASAEIYSLTSNEYQSSNIYNYLNNDFLASLKDVDKYVSDMTVCSDTVSELSKIGCETKLENQKVGLIDINDFTSSIVNDKTYFNTESAIWLINPSSEGQMWVVYNNKLTKDVISERYGVRPVVTLKNDVKIKSGEGTSSNPYILEV